MKVAIGDGRQGTIHVFPGDDPKARAAQFCEKHELTEPKMLRVVEKHIADNIAKLPAHRRKAAEGRRKKEAAAAGPAAAPAADSPAAPRTAPARQKSRKAAAAPAPADEADEAAAPAAAPAVAVPPPRPPTPPTAAPAPAAAPAVAVPPPPPPPPEEPPPAAAFHAAAAAARRAARRRACDRRAAAGRRARGRRRRRPPRPPSPCRRRWPSRRSRRSRRRRWAASRTRGGWPWSGARASGGRARCAPAGARARAVAAIVGGAEGGARARAEMDELHEANSRIAELAFAQAGQPAEVSHHQLLEAMAPKAAMLEADDVKQAAAAKVARLQRKLDGALARLGASAVGAKQVATLTAAFAAFKMVLVAATPPPPRWPAPSPATPCARPSRPPPRRRPRPAPSPAIAVPPPAVAVPPSPLRAAPTFPSVEEAAVQCALGDEQARRASVAASSAADEVRAEVDALKQQLAQREEELHDVTQMLIDARIQHAEINGVSLDLKHELRRAEVALEESRWDAAGAHAESFSKGSSGRKLGLADRRLSFPSIKSPSMGMGSGKRLSMGRDTK